MTRTVPFSKAAIRNACIAAAFAVAPIGLYAIGVIAGPSEELIAKNKANIDRCVELKGDTNACDRIKRSKAYIPNGYQPTVDLTVSLRKEAKAKNEAEKKAAEKREAAAIAERKAKAEEARLARGEWDYSTHIDNATGKSSKYATLTSTNTVNFDWPYSGLQNGYFYIRNHPRFGIDAYLKIQKGQILCDTYSNTTVLVRFDNGPATNYSCGEAADHSSDIVFIRNVGRLEGAMKGAKKMYVTVNVYQEGQQTFEFNVRGYDRTKV